MGPPTLSKARLGMKAKRAQERRRGVLANNQPVSVPELFHLWTCPLCTFSLHLRGGQTLPSLVDFPHGQDNCPGPFSDTKGIVMGPKMSMS